MKVMLLANEAPEDFALREDKEKFDSYMGEWYVFSEVLEKNLGKTEGAALEGPETATVVSMRDGVRHVEDGPYPDAKEQLGGFIIIDAPNMEEAAEWAKKCPSAKNGFVDVRAVPYLEQETSE